MEIQTAARALPRVHVLLVVLLLFPASAAADTPGVRPAFFWGLGCSIAADTADLWSTVYAHRARQDIVEANPVYGQDFRLGSLKRPIIIKSAGAVAVTGTGLWMLHKGWGIWANLLVWGNCIGKAIVTVHNLRIANDAPRATLAWRMSW